MKKVIFISALAIAAAVSCTKSDIVDTKFGNDVIGFENYIGRDAQTKASVATTIGSGAGIYGYYTGSKQYVATATDANPASKTNLWVNGTLAQGGTVDPVKYWTNTEDWYTFAAYAPKDNSNLVVPTTEFTGDPVITYNVPTALSSQIDLLYANAKDQHKPAEGGKVSLPFNHALSRLTVTAEAVKGDFTFTVTNVTVEGGFYTSGKLNLMTGLWSDQVEAKHADDEATADVNEKNDVYTILNTPATLSSEKVDFAGTAKDNYLMFIPTDKAVTLNVTYTITYAGETSKPNNKSFAITPAGGFVKGFAYAVNLNFMLDEDNAITFDVTVNKWDESTPDQVVYPEGKPTATDEPAEE